MKIRQIGKDSYIASCLLRVRYRTTFYIQESASLVARIPEAVVVEVFDQLVSSKVTAGERLHFTLDDR